MYRNSLGFLLTLALLSLTAPSWATHIYVSGDQTGTWSADTVIVTAEVRVPPGQSLTILPGVEVLFSVYCKLIVDSAATLRAVGTAADSIRFDVLPHNEHWHGLRFLSASDSSRLEYCHLRNGWASGSFPDNLGGAIYCINSSPTISNNTIIENLAEGFGGGICCYYSSAIISGNTISGNSTDANGLGGGIYCYSSSLTISSNTISENSGHVGGGIYCFGGNPSISGNTINGNSANSGGGIRADFSSGTISGNTICENSANNAGGGISCGSNSSPSISGNTINGNSANSGGGIHCSGGNPSISGNTIIGNSASVSGGGIHCIGDNPSISGNTIIGNSANWGGGIRADFSSGTISGNTICENSANNAGGGISCVLSSNIEIKGNTICRNGGGGIYVVIESRDMNCVNCILWGNTPMQISGGTPQVTYSDIQGGYTGTGNINIYPAFVDTAQSDYRLQWGSPCIDTGDPHPLYNDPDNTRADMGAWYYDQSMPQRILLTPYNAPIQIPASGGSFDYAIQVTNIGSTTLPTLGWCDVTLPTGPTYGPVLGPLNLTLAPEQTLSRLRTQVVPASAPAGMYHYNAYAVAAGDTSSDSFTFVKLGFGNQESGFGGWTNTGEDFTSEVGAHGCAPTSGSGATPTTVISPNPFNPTTVARYKIQDASYVSLRVYDITGRLVITLVEGWREAGEYQVTFDGSGLAAGVYLYRLEMGDFSAVQKLVLLK